MRSMRALVPVFKAKLRDTGHEIIKSFMNAQK